MAGDGLSPSSPYVRRSTSSTPRPLSLPPDGHAPGFRRLRAAGRRQGARCGAGKPSAHPDRLAALGRVVGEVLAAAVARVELPVAQRADLEPLDRPSAVAHAGRGEPGGLRARGGVAVEVDLAGAD